MKSKLFILLAAAALLLPNPRAFAVEKSAVSDELQALIKKIQTKLQAEKKTEKDLADELKEFDTLLAKHKDEKTDEVANILNMKAMLYLQVIEDTDKGVEAIKQLKRDFPDTQFGKNADKILDSIKQQAEAKKVKSALVKGAKFPDFDEKDVAGKPLSIASYKGKVVLLDFWATWCPPCRAELPSVIKTYEKHHPNGFEIIGISLDKEESKLTSFTKDKGMTWQQFYDGKGWGNKLAVKYGVQSIPATYLLDSEGKILAQDLRGEDLEQAVAKALAKK